MSAYRRISSTETGNTVTSNHSRTSNRSYNHKSPQPETQAAPKTKAERVSDKIHAGKSEYCKARALHLKLYPFRDIYMFALISLFLVALRAFMIYCAPIFSLFLKLTNSQLLCSF